MKKLKLFRTLLVAAMLGVGGSAWAADTSGKTVVGTTVTETYDFNGWGLANLNSKATATIAKASETPDHTVDATNVYEITNPVGNASATLELYHRFAMSNPGTDRTIQQVLFYNSDKSGNRAYFGGTAVTGYVSILDLPKDATITITTEGGNNESFTFQSDNVKDSEGKSVTVGTTKLTSDMTYTVTTAGDVDFSHTTWAGWKKVVIVYEASEEVVTAPALVLTGTNGNNRTITVTDGTSSDGTATIATYYTTNGDIPTSLSTAVVGSQIVVSESCTIKAISISSKGGESPVTELAVEAGTPIVLNNPVISRTANKSVSISAPQSVLGTPVATIYYRIGESGDFTVYSAALTVSSHNTVYAYAAASGYANSSTVSREVDFVASNLPQTESLDKVSYKDGGIDTENSTDGGTMTTYYPIKADGNQWGHNIYFQNATNCWTIRGNNTWVIGNASSANGWMLVKDLKKDDVVVVRIDEGALATVNATYVEKYSYNGHYAYSVTANGNIELRFARKADKTNNVLYGVDQYTATISATIGTTGYTTFSSAYPLNLDGITGGSAYYVSATTSTAATLAEATGTVAAGEGLLLSGTPGAKVTIPVAATGTAISGNKLVGCPTSTTLTVNSSYYVLVNNGGTPQFQCLDANGATIPAGKAYLNAAGAGARLDFVFEDEATGISNVSSQMEEGRGYYDLQGRRVAQPTKGLYIVNGKKMVIK